MNTTTSLRLNAGVRNAKKRDVRVFMQQQPRYGFTARASSSATIPAREKIFELLDSGRYGMYRSCPELVQAVSDLISMNPTPEPGFKSLSAGQGTWQVFHAPHIESMSSFMGVKFNPIRYHLEGNALISNVKFEVPFLGTGWLSASGTMDMKNADDVEIHFDKFWIDMGDRLRSQVAEADIQDPISKTIMQLGRASFFPQFATFPVLYLDQDFCVFKFPPLNTSIAVRRVLALPPVSSANQ